MIDSSEGELGSETLASSDSCSTSCTRISFETFSPEQTSSTKPNHSGLSFRDFEIVRLIGRGDIGNVYLCRLKNSSKNDLFYAMKVVDKDAMAFKNKIHRAETEKRILKMLNHPFLPTLYTHFEASQFSCVVMEFCSGGDLHSLRHKQPGKRFSLTTARFYAAEVLVALEYLHMLGIIYRDLKPENVLVRSDGHIMLFDFDLSLCSDSIPAVEALDHNICSSSSTTNKHLSCLFNSTQNRLSHHRFVAEPVSARSNSFVGTHEYVSPEVASGKSHGNAVDWWALGIFIYELVWGTTPFIGGTNKETLHNILKKPLKFPKITHNTTKMERSTRDLISRLLVKEPESRLGAQRGAADVKTHPFFKGINFALLRSYPPPIPAVTGCANRGGGLSTTSSVAFDYF